MTALETLDSAGVRLVEQVAPSVVLVRSNRGEGSGVIYRADGFVMTNAHVVSGASKVKVFFHDGSEEEGSVIKDSADGFNDIAIVKVNKKDLPAARFADSGTVRPGQMAIAIGAPFGLAESVSFGHVSALGRQNFIPDPEAAGRVRGYFNMIQTDAAINPGNSGGPLMNYRGEVIGINSAINSTTGIGSGVGFAIPSNTARIVADQLIANGKISRAYVGLQPSDLKLIEASKLGIKEGAIVRSVSPNTPAAEAGIKENDVVVEIAGRAIRGEQDLRDSMLLNAPGKPINFKVFRDGKTLSLQVKPTTRPAENAIAQPRLMPEDDDGMPFSFGPTPDAPDNAPDATPDVSTPVRLGVEVRDLSADEKNIAPGGSGVMVTKVETGSVAARAGLKEGYVITQIGNKRVTTKEELRQEIAKFKKGDTTMLSFGKADRSGMMTMSVTVRF
jgi:serine protease Do